VAAGMSPLSPAWSRNSSRSSAEYAFAMTIFLRYIGRQTEI
jgi:hypothetical protein